MVRAVLSIVCALISFAGLMIFFPPLRGVRRKGEQMTEAAKKAGRTAQGALISSDYQPSKDYDSKTPRQWDYWDVIYEYQVDGASYQFHGLMQFPQSSPPKTITLYYEAGAPADAAPSGYGRYKQDGASFRFFAMLPALLFLFFYLVIFKSV